MMTDPIADMLTRIRNAGRVQHAQTRCPASKLKLAIVKVLAEEGFVSGVSQIGDDNKKPEMVIDMRYDASGQTMIASIQRVSKPGRRTYLRSSEVEPVKSGLGMTILSTSKGVMCDRDARAQNIGGEVLCEVW